MIKILIQKETKLIKASNHFKYELKENSIICYNSETEIDFTFGCHNKYDCEVFEIENLPENFENNKYKFINNEFILNDKFVKPTTEN